MEIGPLLGKVANREHLSLAEASSLMKSLIKDATPVQIGAALTALQMKGVTNDEIAGFARTLRADCVPVVSPVKNHIDTCGTGGGVSSFNVSTAAAIIAAGAGATVAKHGNRAITGRCGSADVLEAIGVPLCETPEDASRRLNELGFAFLFAPKFHPSGAKMGPIRKELPFRTVFNVLGPLLNPAGARRQIVGVWEPGLLSMVAEALVRLDTEFAIVVHGEPGMDEISPISVTQVRVVENGEVTREEWTPATFGAKPVDLSALLSGETPLDNGQLLEEAVTQVSSPKCLAVLPSAAVAVRLAGLADDWKGAYELALETVRSGASASKLERLKADA
jgi:anthranilate phosphoribosyltransferase